MAIAATADRSNDPYWQLASAQIPIERQRESSTTIGQPHPPVPDNAGHVGVDQIGQAALDDVNRDTGTSYTLDDLRTNDGLSDYVARHYNYLLAKEIGPAALQNPALVRMAYRVGVAGMKRGDYLKIGAGDTYSPDVQNVSRALGMTGQSDALGADFQRISTLFPPVDSSRVQPTIDALRSSLVAQKAETEGIRRQSEADYGEDRARARTAYDAANKDDTTPWNKPPPPRDVLEGFASAGSVFAAIASAFTRTPAVSAMNGMAAAINARRDGNQKAYDEAYKVWQDNTKLAIDRQKLASDRLSQALQMMTTDSAHGAALLNQALVEHGDDRVQIMAAAGMWDKVDEANQARNRAIANTAVAYQRILHPAGARPQILTDPGTKDESGNPIQYIWNPSETGENKFVTLAGEPYIPKGASRMGSGPTGGTNPLTPDAADMQARFYLKTGTIPAGFGGQGMRTQIIERAKDIAKSEGKSVDDYIEGRATLRADTASLGAVTKQMNAAEGYERGAVKALDLAVHMIPPTAEPLDMQTLTRWVRTGETEFGDVKVPAYMAQMIVSLDQYAKVLTGATGAQGSTDSARNLALSLIPPGATSQQIPEIANTLKKDMALKIQGYTEQINNIRQGIAAPTAPGPVTPTPGMPAEAAKPAAPAVGEVRKGYRFKGGNPADQSSWEKAE